jgi:hypothetical protein
MPKVIITYRLKPGVTKDAFETWVREKDQPTMRSIQRVQAFNTYRIEGPLFPGGPATPQYIELFDIPDLEGFGSQDVPGPVVQGIMAEFDSQVADVEYLVATDV